MHENNRKIARIFAEMGKLYQMQETADPFRALAYQKAARLLTGLDEDVASYQNEKGEIALPGIGKAMSEKISEFLRTGNIAKYDSLRKKFPPHLLDLLEVRNLGPETLKKLYKTYGIRNMKDLADTLRKKRKRKLKGIGEKKAQALLKEIETHSQTSKRMLLWDAIQEGNMWLKVLTPLSGVKHCEVAGSTRRGKETVGDIDLVVSAAKKDHAGIIAAFAGSEHVKTVLNKGRTKASVISRSNGCQADLRVVEPASRGAALMYFTGSKDHTLELRIRAKKMGFKMSEYGLFDERGRQLAGKTEKEMYKALGLAWIPPELREHRGEIELAEKNKIPALVEPSDIKGDLQLHSNWSDGNSSISDIADFVTEHYPHYEFLVLTDHSKTLRIAGGLTEQDFRMQWKEIDKVNRRLGRKFIKKGVEVEILRDGSLDFDEQFLSKFDWVVASIHSGFQQANTERLIRACQNPFVHAIGHPSGKIYFRREPYRLDMEKVTKAAKETGTALEINGQRDRMDIDETWANYAREQGVDLVLSTDSHRLNEFGYMKLSLAIARRARCAPGDILNTKSWSEIEKWKLKKKKRASAPALQRH